MAVQTHLLSALCLLQVCPSICHSRCVAARAAMGSGYYLDTAAVSLRAFDRPTSIHTHARQMRQEKHSLTSCTVAHFFLHAFPSRRRQCIHTTTTSNKLCLF